MSVILYGKAQARKKKSKVLLHLKQPQSVNQSFYSLITFTFPSPFVLLSARGSGAVQKQISDEFVKITPLKPYLSVICFIFAVNDSQTA